MAFWSRRRASSAPPPGPATGGTPSADGPRDDGLPMLSVDQAAALYAMVLPTFGAVGLDVETDFDGTVHAPDGRVFGLHNLALLVAGQPFDQWQRTVMRHVEAVSEPAPDAPADPSRWLLMLRAAVDLPMPVDYDIGTALPGLVAIPAIDLPTSVHELLAQEKVERYGPLEQFRTRALANLRALPAPVVTTIPADPDRRDADVLVLATDDFFGAARVLVWEQLLAEHLRLERPALGVLVAVPNRHLLAVHPITGPGVFAALELLSRMAVGEHASRPGPVSPHVFHLPVAGPGQQLTEHPPEGGVRVIADGAFAQVLENLGDDG